MVRQIVQSTSTDVYETTEKSLENKCRPSSHGIRDKEVQMTGSMRNSKDHYFQKIFGFEKHDLASREMIVRLLCRPSDPASLGILRFLFGFLMIMDTVDERGFARAEDLWGRENDCYFPLFTFLSPLPLQWMYIIYIIMLTGACGIMLGLKMKFSSALFLASYWYILLLDKMSWNNHSYLFGILAFLFAISDANRFWSLDGLLDSKISNAHVPLWNYTLIRLQIFVVYFIAGLKKCDMDWVSGYSMAAISTHWIFNPFKLLLTENQINLYIVHLGGLFIDLFIGFLLFLDQTRIFGLCLCSTFHLMNSQIFSIGMFPYAMLVTQLAFCDMNWPRRLINVIPPKLRLFHSENTHNQSSSHCVYTKEYVKSETLKSKERNAYSGKAPPTIPTWRHKLASLFTLTFIAWQFFLPYSHGITKGYNSWTNGLYGYSWDMMVHSWSVQHARITYYDKDTDQSGYLDPKAWTGGATRCFSGADMIKQYAHCIADNLKKYSINNVSIYFDIWMSLNHRFHQRVIDPQIDIITAEWSPFSSTTWMLPLMADLSNWRTKLEKMYTTLSNETYADVVFVADFPGMYLENYVHPDFGNTTITVLSGKVMIEFTDENKNITLGPDQSLQVPPDGFHNVHTISEIASTYMYLFVNTTDVAFIKSYKEFEEDYNTSTSLNETLQKYNKDPNLDQYQKILEDKQAQESETQQTVWEIFKRIFKIKYYQFIRSIYMGAGAVYCLATNSSFDKFLNDAHQWEDSGEANLTM